MNSLTFGSNLRQIQVHCLLKHFNYVEKTFQIRWKTQNDCQMQNDIMLLNLMFFFLQACEFKLKNKIVQHIQKLNQQVEREKQKKLQD
ncbi:unnamed protein product [Paramecium primaurelia]|uniref:Uncharacterized protein n=1 Tax=Paramecium primaurelia TaxID=5886 RepID=A0A8S1MNU9_PARPR|nr:unnamed protein product [Paramecium primaurelia]